MRAGIYLWIGALPALAGAVVEELPQAVIDWTEQKLLVEASSERGGSGVSDLKTIEQAAHSVLTPRVEASARLIRLDGELEAGVAMEGGEVVAEILAENLLRWKVTEARYYTSGRVELRAELDLQAWLSPAVTALAAGREDPSRPSSNTGVLIDARSTGLKPSFSPRVLGTSGERIYSAASLSPETATRLSPVVWVTDPADEAAVRRVGANPLFVRAQSPQGCCDIALDPRDAALLQVLQSETDLLTRALVVVVVDP